jgi:cytoskeletal protein CcmA (bactofilin family)
MATVKTNPNLETNMTLIGQSVRIQGNLSGDEDLHVLGRVDGRIELQRTLIVAQSGIVKAEVNVKNAVISGVVVGNIHATESVELTREGRMVGDIFAPRVIIVDGASFRGTVDMGDIENMPMRKAGSERPRPMTAPTPSTRPAAAKPSTSTLPKPAPKPAAPPAPAAPPPPPPQALPTHDDVADADGDDGDIDGDAPQAKGLPNKAQKARVIVKRR